MQISSPCGCDFAASVANRGKRQEAWARKRARDQRVGGHYSPLAFCPLLLFSRSRGKLSQAATPAEALAYLASALARCSSVSLQRESFHSHRLATPEKCSISKWFSRRKSFGEGNGSALGTRKLTPCNEWKWKWKWKTKTGRNYPKWSFPAATAAVAVALARQQRNMQQSSRKISRLGFIGSGIFNDVMWRRRRSLGLGCCFCFCQQLSNS